MGKLVVCKNCSHSYSFPSRKLEENHNERCKILVPFGLKDLKCTICPFETDSSKKFLFHFSLKHPEKSRSVPTTPHFTENLPKNLFKNCQFCNDEILVKSFEFHISQCQNFQALHDEHRCKLCFEQCPNIRETLIHIKKNHFYVIPSSRKVYDDFYKQDPDFEQNDFKTPVQGKRKITLRAPYSPEDEPLAKRHCRRSLENRPSLNNSLTPTREYEVFAKYIEKVKHQPKGGKCKLCQVEFNRRILLCQHLKASHLEIFDKSDSEVDESTNNADEDETKKDDKDDEDYTIE